MSIDKQRTRRLIEATVLGSVGTIFLVFGVLMLLNQGIVLGLGFMVLGVLTEICALSYAVRGSRLGAEIINGDVIVRHYFSERRFPVKAVKRIYRSVDATVLEMEEGQCVIDDSMFADEILRERFVVSLEQRLSNPREG